MINKKSVFLFLTVLLLLILIVFIVFKRSLTINKGYRLVDCNSGTFTFDVWSYGNWVQDESITHIINTYEPPYDLLVAIRSQNSEWKKFHMIKASVIRGDSKIDIMPKLYDRVVPAISRQHDRIKEPYAVFRFDSAIKFCEQFILKISFRNPDASYRDCEHNLVVPCFEEKRVGIYIFDGLMGI